MMSMTREAPRPPPPPNPPPKPPPPPSSATLILWIAFKSTRSCAMTSSGTSRRSTTIRMFFRDIRVMLSIAENTLGRWMARGGWHSLITGRPLGPARYGATFRAGPRGHPVRERLPHGALAGHKKRWPAPPLKLFEIELGGGTAQLDVLDVLGVAFLGGLNRCYAELLIGGLDLDWRCNTLVTLHVGEDGVGAFHLQRGIARRQLCAAYHGARRKCNGIGLGAGDGQNRHSQHSKQK